MNFLERDLEDIIFNSTTEQLSDRGLWLPPKSYRKRQLRIGNYGVADIVCFEKPYFHIGDDGYKGHHEDLKSINVLELKQDKIGVNAFLKAVGYVKGIQRYIESCRNNYYFNYSYKITLIGREIDKDSTFSYLPDIVSEGNFTLSLYTYSYDVDGIKFQEHTGYKLINEGFKNNKNEF